MPRPTASAPRWEFCRRSIRDDPAIFQPVRSAQHDLDRLAIDTVLLFEYPGGKRFDRVVVEHGHDGLANDGARVKILIHEVDRTAGDFDTMFERLILRVEPGKSRQQ